MTRLEAACGLAILAREVCDEVEIFTFSNEVKKVPPRRGFALRDAIVASQPHGGTLLGAAVAAIDQKGTRLIVFTDEQSHDQVPAPKGNGIMINVASYQHGVGSRPVAAGRRLLRGDRRLDRGDRSGSRLRPAGRGLPRPAGRVSVTVALSVTRCQSASRSAPSSRITNGTASCPCFRPRRRHHRRRQRHRPCRGQALRRLRHEGRASPTSTTSALDRGAAGDRRGVRRRRRTCSPCRPTSASGKRSSA